MRDLLPPTVADSADPRPPPAKGYGDLNAVEDIRFGARRTPTSTDPAHRQTHRPCVDDRDSCADISGRRHLALLEGTVRASRDTVVTALSAPGVLEFRRKIRNPNSKILRGGKFVNPFSPSWGTSEFDMQTFLTCRPYGDPKLLLQQNVSPGCLSDRTARLPPPCNMPINLSCLQSLLSGRRANG